MIYIVIKVPLNIRFFTLILLRVSGFFHYYPLTLFSFTFFYFSQNLYILQFYFTLTLLRSTSFFYSFLVDVFSCTVCAFNSFAIRFLSIYLFDSLFYSLSSFCLLFSYYISSFPNFFFSLSFFFSFHLSTIFLLFSVLLF